MFTSREWFSNSLPAIIVFMAFSLDLVSILPHPRPFRTLWCWISSPFCNFLTLDDLILDPVDRTPKFSHLKTRMLTGLSSLAVVGWVGILVFSVYMSDQDYLIRSLIYTVSWVSCYYISLRRSNSTKVLYCVCNYFKTSLNSSLPLYRILSGIGSPFTCGISK